MKKFAAFMLALILLVSFCGCKEQKEPSNKLFETEKIKCITVTSLNDTSSYVFRGNKIDILVSHLSNLNLSTDFDENPTEQNGLSWAISTEYQNGKFVKLHRVGNEFIRRKNGVWYKMDSAEANYFEALLQVYGD